MNQQPGYNPYQPQQPQAPAPQNAYQPQAQPQGYAPMGQAPAPGAYNPYAPPTAGSEQPMYGMDMEVQVLADRGTRLGAAFVDGLLYIASFIPGGILGGLLFAAAGEDEAMLGAVGLGALTFLAFSIYQWVLISNTGQSLAKKWLGIKIVKLDGELPGFVHGVLLRIWVMGFIGNIPVVGPICSLVDPLLIFGDERRCLHDHIAGTKVIVA